MCGIVGAIAQRNVTEILVEGLRRLEYRGYDSAGVAIIDGEQKLQVRKTAGKVAILETLLAQQLTQGHLGIAHTRWATHGVPSEANAHPHLSGTLAVVHNGIIENHVQLRKQLQDKGYVFVSQTDTEVIAHLLHDVSAGGGSLADRVRQVVAQLEGAYALAVVDAAEPNILVGVRHGSPLVLGVGIEENFLASDQMALRQVTDRFVFLEEDDLVEVRRENFTISDKAGKPVKRPISRLEGGTGESHKGHYRHFMLKEIYEQPAVLAATLQGRISDNHLMVESFGQAAGTILAAVKNIHLVACGTSYHAGLVAKYWIESLARIPCHVEVASEYRYRNVVVPEKTLFVSISQSGETADTLAALRDGQNAGYLGSLTVCNVANSSLVRESDLAFMTHAGVEIGVASTKAFTTQLAVLQMFAIALAKTRGLSRERETQLVEALHQLPDLAQKVLELDKQIETTFESFVEKHHALFLGRGEQYPIALEGALKLKEISYIHAEAYPAGELKHGPLALVDDDMPVVAVAPNNDLLEKLKSNLHEVQARGGKLTFLPTPTPGLKMKLV